MTVAAWPLRRSRWFSIGVALGVLLPALALVALSAVGSCRSTSPEAERRAFIHYEEAVERAVREGGFVVTQGMQPGLADIAEGALPDATLVTMARGWKGVIERVRAEFGSVEPPAFLEETARLYDGALAAYVAVAETLLAAADARGAQRLALIERVPVLGRRADDLWGRAEAELERHRSRLGLGKEDRS